MGRLTFGQVAQCRPCHGSGLLLNGRLPCYACDGTGLGRIDGPDVTPPDTVRLHGQLLRAHEHLIDGHWCSIVELAEWLGSSQTSASARLRDLRKHRFGRHVIERQRVRAGIWRYRMLPASCRCAR